MSWSGGKDSAIALHELLRSDAYEAVSLLTTVSEEYRRISHHGVRESLLDARAEAIGIPLRKVYLPSSPAGRCTNEVYESIMKEVMLAYRREGVRTVAFGDLFLEDLRAWREANLAQVGIRGLFPIWKRNTTELAHEVIRLGYKAYLSCVEAIVGSGFVGRLYDEEFHSFVFDGPIFKRPVAVTVGDRVARDGRHYADLLSAAANSRTKNVVESIPPV